MMNAEAAVGGALLRDLKVFADAGMAHGWLHAHGFILFESMRCGPFFKEIAFTRMRFLHHANFMRPWQMIGIALPACLLGLLAGLWIGSGSGKGNEPGTRQQTAMGKAALTFSGHRGGAAGGAESLAGSGKGIVDMSDEALAEAVESALKEKDHLKRTSRFSLLLAEIDQAGLRRIQNELGTCYNKGWDTGEFGEMVSAREGGFLGEEGMKEIPKEPNGTPSFRVKSRMRGWASADPMAGKQWLDGLEPGKVKNELSEVWLQGAKLADPTKIAELLPTLPEGKLTDALAGRVVEGALLEHGREGMAAWFAENGSNIPESVRMRIYRRMVDSFTQNPDEAFQTVDILKQIGNADEEMFGTGVLQMAWRTARYNPERTLDLLNEYGPQNEFLAGHRSDFIQKCIEGSSVNTIDTIGNWLNTNPGSPYYNDVVQQFFNQIRPLDPEGAKAWAATVKDEKMRNQLLLQIQGQGPP